MAVEPLLVHSGDARQAIDAIVDFADIIRHLAEPQGNLSEKLLMQLKLACDLVKLLLKPPLAIALHRRQQLYTLCQGFQALINVHDPILALF